MRPANTPAEKMIKVDHVGENGAVNIYRAQTIVAKLRAPHLHDELMHFLEHEKAHRVIFANYLKSNSIRRCISYHLSGLGGFSLGFITRLIGPKAIFATTYAVENVVLSHLEHQMEYLKDIDIEAHNCVKSIVIDEREHHDTAESQLADTSGWLEQALISVVKFCTENVIRFGMR